MSICIWGWSWEDKCELEKEKRREEKLISYVVYVLVLLQELLWILMAGISGCCVKENV